MIIYFENWMYLLNTLHYIRIKVFGLKDIILIIIRSFYLIICLFFVYEKEKTKEVDEKKKEIITKNRSQTTINDNQSRNQFLNQETNLIKYFKRDITNNWDFIDEKNMDILINQKTIHLEKNINIQNNQDLEYLKIEKSEQKENRIKKKKKINKLKKNNKQIDCFSNSPSQALNLIKNKIILALIIFLNRRPVLWFISILLVQIIYVTWINCWYNLFDKVNWSTFFQETFFLFFIILNINFILDTDRFFEDLYIILYFVGNTTSILFLVIGIINKYSKKNDLEQKQSEENIAKMRLISEAPIDSEVSLGKKKIKLTSRKVEKNEISITINKKPTIKGKIISNKLMKKDFLSKPQLVKTKSNLLSNTRKSNFFFLNKKRTIR